MKETVTLVATARTYFGNRWRNPGEEFEATESQSRLLTATHRAKIKADDSMKRQYKRRDMKAED